MKFQLILLLFLFILSAMMFAMWYYFQFHTFGGEKICNLNSNPFIAVVKFKSAEAVLDFEKASQFINLDRVYPEAINNSETPEELWKRISTRRYNYGQPGKKNANAHIFQYYRWNISETISNNNAKVIFSSIKDESIKIIFLLEKKDDKWIIVSIDYYGVPVVDSDRMMVF